MGNLSGVNIIINKYIYLPIIYLLIYFKDTVDINRAFNIKHNWLVVPWKFEFLTKRKKSNYSEISI